MPRMRWVRLWTQETLYGTTNRELTLEERAIWFEMLALAGDSPTPGIICVSPGVSFTDAQLSSILGASEALIRQAKTKLSDPEINKININGTGCIQIANWPRYQAEFNREEYQREYMRSYRKRKTNARKTNVPKSQQQTRTEGKGREQTRSTTPHPSPQKMQKPQKEIRVSSLSEDPVFLQELAVKFPQLDIHLELVACDDHWGTRVKAPKKAFINWLQRALQFRTERSSNGRLGKDRSVPGNRPAGAFADLEDN